MDAFSFVVDVIRAARKRSARDAANTTTPTSALEPPLVPMPPPDTETAVIVDDEGYTLYIVLGGLVLVGAAGAVVWGLAGLAGLLAAEVPPDAGDDGHPTTGIVLRMVVQAGASANAVAMGIAAAFGHAPAVPGVGIDGAPPGAGGAPPLGSGGLNGAPPGAGCPTPPGGGDQGVAPGAAGGPPPPGGRV
nr:putative cuticle collagen 91 [Aegilops tauschii subsp. strangulata]